MWVRSLAQKDSLEKVWQPTSVFLPGESHGHMSLAGSSPWSWKRKSDTTEVTQHAWVTTLVLTTTHAVGKTTFPVLQVKWVCLKCHTASDRFRIPTQVWRLGHIIQMWKRMHPLLFIWLLSALKDHFHFQSQLYIRGDIKTFKNTSSYHLLQHPSQFLYYLELDTCFQHPSLSVKCEG